MQVFDFDCGRDVFEVFGVGGEDSEALGFGCGCNEDVEVKFFSDYAFWKIMIEVSGDLGNISGEGNNFEGAQDEFCLLSVEAIDGAL